MKTHIFLVTVIDLGIVCLAHATRDGSIEVDYASKSNSSSSYEYDEESSELESEESRENKVETVEPYNSPFKGINDYMRGPPGILPLYNADGTRIQTEEIHATVQKGKIDKMYYDAEGKRVMIPILLREEDFHEANLTNILEWMQWVDDMRSTLLDLKKKATSCKPHSDEEVKGYESVSVMLTDIQDALRTLDNCENKLNSHLRDPEKKWNYPAERRKRSVDSVSLGQMKSIPLSEEEGNNSPEIRKNFQNLFSSIKENNVLEAASYRHLLENEAAREKQVFEMTKGHWKMPRMRTQLVRDNTGQRAAYVSKRDAGNQSNSDLVDVQRDSKLIERYENTYKKIKEAKTETEVIEAANAYRDTARNEVNDMHHDLIQFYCAIRISRMCLDEVYEKEVRSSPSSPADTKTITENWKNMVLKALHNATEGSYAHRFRESYKHFIHIDSAYADEFALSATKLPELCRRYEAMIPEIQATYETQLKSGSRLSLADLLANHTDWGMVNDDIYTINRIREAENRDRISWAWLLDETNQKVIPYCANHNNPKIIFSSVENALRQTCPSNETSTAEGHAPVNGTSTAKGHAYVNGTSTAEGHASVNGTSTAKGHASVNGTSTAEGHASFNGTSTAEEHASKTTHAE